MLILTLPPVGASSATVKVVQTENQARLENFVTMQKVNLRWVAIPDIIYSAIFFIFLIVFERYAKRITRESEKKTSLPSHYTVEISGFPSTIIDSSIISSHFR